MTPALARLWCLAFGHEWLSAGEPVKCRPQEYVGDRHARCARCGAERGPGYVAWVVSPGKCVVEGCDHDAVSFCDEHKPKIPKVES